VTKYDWFRRRIAPVAFGVAILVMARESCRKNEHGRATFVIDLGPATSEVKVVDAELWLGGQQVAVFHRAALPGGTIGVVKFEAMLPATDGELRIGVERPGKHDAVVRRVHA
jgi:hypothetical protein